ncbi:hypothetical protein OCF14_08870 [Bacillus cereus]|nr:hypothetical protein [Bacillus cereus]MCU5143236.1 hypothetical protein [Bacillus cereus]
MKKEMIVYNLVKERLMQHKFMQLELDWNAELGVVTFRKEHILVFLKLYDNPAVKSQDIIEDIVKVRRKLEKRPEFNIWNSYMLVCLNTSFDSYIELVMKVEKDTTAIRKYLVNEEKDLDRIPFLDNTRSKIVEPKKWFDKETFSELGDIQEIVDYIRKFTFEDGEKLTPKKAKNLLEEKYKKELVIDEDQKSSDK